MTELDDNDLVKQCLQGRTGVFKEFVDKYQKPIYNVALRMVNDRDDAEDIAQSVFVKAYEHLGSFDPRYKFFSWLYRMAVNESLNFLRQKKKYQALGDDHECKDFEPDRSCEEHDQAQRIETALMHIDVEYRSVLVLRHFLDLTYKEIGEICDISEKTVKSRLYTARHLMRDILIGMGVHHA